jgi:Tfp pilus assembly protein PilZ
MPDNISKQVNTNIITRQKFLCPSCKVELDHDFTQDNPFPKLACPHCESIIKLPSLPKKNVKTLNERREQRCEADGEVSYTNFNEFITKYTRNVSKGGMFIVSDKPPVLLSAWILNLTSHKLDEPIYIVGEVTHKEHYTTESDSEGIGVKFVDIAPESRNRLILLIRSLHGSK